MSFWGIELKPKKAVFDPWKSTQIKKIRITQATLGVGDDDDDDTRRTTTMERSVVECFVGGAEDPILICSLLPNTSESCNLNLVFAVAENNDTDTAVMFCVSGPRSVHLSGYSYTTTTTSRCRRRLQKKKNDMMRSSDDIDTEEESSYHSSDHDNYDYQDSFINDDDDDDDDDDAAAHHQLSSHYSPPSEKRRRLIRNENVEIEGCRRSGDDEYKEKHNEQDSINRRIKGSDLDEKESVILEQVAAKAKDKHEYDDMIDDPNPNANTNGNSSSINNVIAVPAGTQVQQVHVIAKPKLMDNNYIFESTSTPSKFRLGDGQVINDGFNAGIQGMRVGDKRTLIIPSSMGYGKEGCGEKSVPPNSRLVCEVELISVDD